jgi:hypothetical protein
MDDLMKHMNRLLGAILLTACGNLALAQTAPLDAKSDQPQGLVSLSSDLALNDGRLIIKVVAFNKGATATDLSPANITVTTAAGKAVPLASLAQLEDETRVAMGGKALGGPSDYAAASAMQRPTVVTASGERDVSGYTGGDGTASAVMPSHGKKKVDESTDPKLKAALEGLRAGVLQPTAVAPHAAAGGQVVTQAFKFSRKEERKLRVAIEFAGEHHEFEFEVPPP